MEMPMAMKRAIPYYRVSTYRQGQSGLGLDAQRKSVHDFATSNNLELLGEFIEVESGRSDKRPVLKTVLQACEREKAVLLIAKLDRLSRNVAFVSKLMESRIEFVAVDYPGANKIIVHIMAAFAEYERDQISTRTKDALRAAKSRGIELGAYGKRVLAKRNKETANAFALTMEPVIARLKKGGFRTVRQISEELNRLRIAPFRGEQCRWHPYTVCAVMKRIRQLQI